MCTLCICIILVIVTKTCFRGGIEGNLETICHDSFVDDVYVTFTIIDDVWMHSLHAPVNISLVRRKNEYR